MTVPCHQGPNSFCDFVKQFRAVHRLLSKLEDAPVNPREVEQVFDQTRHEPGLTFDCGSRAIAHPAVGRFLDHCGSHENRAEGLSQLVSQLRQKIGFCLAMQFRVCASSLFAQGHRFRVRSVPTLSCEIRSSAVIKAS